MNTSPNKTVALALILTAVAGLSVSPRVDAQASNGGINVSQQPLFTQVAEPPLNMLVMGKDTKNYFQSYNDASDLNGDGKLDIGYKPGEIDYFGNFNSKVCYVWSTDKFVPSSATANKKCSGKWSGDFLNYVTTSRMDALRRVLYGGWRQVDTATETVLQGAYFPQDGHSWGKEYQSFARDGYNISDYAPLTAPPAGRYILFAVTGLKGNNNAYPNYQAPALRVLVNTDKRVWNWLSIEGPVAGNKCFTTGNVRTDCVPPAGGTWDVAPSSDFSGLTITTWKHTGASPTNTAGMDSFFGTYAKNPNKCGSGSVSLIDTSGSNNNPFAGTNGCGQDNYLTRISGNLVIATAGTYRFAVDGDDAVDVAIDGNVIVGRYGPNGSNRSSANLMTYSAQVTLSAGSHPIEFRHQEGSGGDNWGLLRLTPGAVVTLTDYQVRVQTCPASDAALRESTCKAYPNGQYKPTGILHDYGETTRMNFGLITGSQSNNLEGGVLRRNMGSFGDEIDSNTGRFKSTVNGIANSISEFRMIGGGYAGGVTDNTGGDTGWNWANGTGNCTSQGARGLNNGECRMWGNPLAEMLYESMRYYAGAAQTPRFNVASSPGDGEETTMNLKKEVWKDPYGSAATGGGGFPICARPFQTIISDINPSYDGDVPGSAFAGAITTTGTTPATISGFSASSEGQAIWNAEFGGSKDVFIGEVNGVTDGLPTAKTASSFGNIRGLSPEEPSKGGTYYTASVARFERLNDMNAAPGPQKVSTYAIALASPLPRIEFPIGGGKITLVPFGKTASGTFGTGVRKPTNTIVTFYVESIANFPNEPVNLLVNGGYPYAVFRINYEDVEQGNDFDMDAIVRYLVKANADGTVTVTLNSEYAAGSADQNLGYVMSGTTQDGVYLDVKDVDSGPGSFVPYAYNTPNPVLPGGCAVATPPAACNAQLPLTSTRVFTPNQTGNRSAAIFLNDPLWYAAKYGAPVPGNNDVDGDGVPDNYFLVTNPATLRAQLDKAFQDIITNSLPAASIATSSPRYTPGFNLAYEASYNANDWTGDLKSYQLSPDGTYANASPIWSASAKMPAHGVRNIFTVERSTSGVYTGVPLTVAGMSTATKTTLQGSLDPNVFVPSELIDYLRGDKSREVGQLTCTPTTCMYRKRSTNLGDILNSTPEPVGVQSSGYSQLPTSIATAAAVNSYVAYVASKKTEFGNNNNRPVIFVGANDGMLHAIDGRETTGGGVELFAYMPRSIIAKVHELARPNYSHKYLVDGQPTISDAYLGGSWKSVLVASVGAGGKGIYALDVTAPRSFSASKVMWEFDNSVDSDMGQFVGRPSVGLTPDSKWVAVFGNGYNSDNQHAVLFIRDLATGATVAKLDTGVGCPTTQVGCTTGPNGMATAKLVDNTGDGVGDTIYAGDYLGNVWRFEYISVGNTWQIGNGGQPIFVAKEGTGALAKRQSITSGIRTVAHPQGGTMLVFGTGRYLNADDADDSTIGQGSRPSVDTIYGIWDATRVYDPATDTFITTATDSNNNAVNLLSLMSLAGGRDALQQQQFTSYTPLTDTGTGGFRTATRNPVEFRTPDSPGSAASPRYMGWYLDLKFQNGGTGSNLLAGERVTATPGNINNDVVINVFQPSGNSCSPGSRNATLVLDALTGAASFTPITPAAGWPLGQQPPAGAIAGTDTGFGPPPGEPPIIVVRPPVPVVPCLPSDPTCTAPPPTAGTVNSCSWRSPNAANRIPGKLIPCGRISWKQLR